MATNETQKIASSTLRKPWKSLLGASALAIAATSFSAMATAQEGQDASEEEATQRTLGTVIVSATKRDESLQDVPIAIVAVDGDKLANQGVERLSQVSDFIPNVVIGNNDAPARPVAIRGLGSGNNRGFETSVGLFIDGAYLGRELFLTDTFFDLERIEAIKGPQGALFGKNTIAGAISMISKNPTDEFEAELSLSAGSQDKIGLDAMISGPITDTLKGRLYFQTYDREGFLENTFSGETVGDRTVSAARAKLLWEPTDNFDAAFTASFSDLEQDGVGVQAIDSSPCLALIDPNAPAGALGCIPGAVVSLFSNFGQLSTVGVGSSIDPNFESNPDDRVSINSGTGDERKTSFFSVNANWDVGDHIITYNGSHAKIDDSLLNFDPDYTAVEINRLILGEDYSQDQHELRLTSPEGEFLEYIAGVYYFSSDIDGLQDLRVNQPFPGPPQGQVVSTMTQETESWSLFGQGTLNFTDNFRLVTGLRYIEEDKTGLSEQVPEPTLFIFPGYSVPLEFSDDAFLVNVAAEYDITDDVMLYGSYNQGFKAGGLNFFSLSGTNFTYDSEESDGYEIGLKSTILDGSATLNLAAFYTEFSNLQTSVLVGNALEIGNAAEAISQGLEAEFQWRATENLTTAISAAYLNAEYDSYPDGPCSVALEINSVPPCSQDLSGVRLDGAPETSGAWNVSYFMPLEEFVGDLNFSFDVVYRSEMTPFNASRNDPLHDVDSVTKLNGRIALDSHDGHWTIALLGTNLTDEVDIFSVSDAFQFPGSRFANLNPPRQWSVKGTYRW